MNLFIINTVIFWEGKKMGNNLLIEISLWLLCYSILFKN